MIHHTLIHQDSSTSDVLDAAVGHKKVRCPQCGEASFSATRDGSFGRCWRPSCTYHIHRYGGDDFSASALIHRALSPILDVFRKTLFEDDAGREAREYLGQRGVHPFIVPHAALGAVPPNFNPQPFFDEPLRAAHEYLEKLRVTSETKKNKTAQRSIKRAVNRAEAAVKILQDAGEKLRRCCWPTTLTFFRSDNSRRFTSIGFRKPFSKDMAIFQPIKRRRGVFGFELWTHDIIPTTRSIIVEGEFNALALQSLMVRQREAEGREPETGLLCCLAVGSCNDIDTQTIVGVARNSQHPPLVIYDLDDSGAGYKIVEQLCSVRDCYAVCTEAPFKDIDELIRSFGPDAANAVAAIRGLITRCQRLAFRAKESPDDPHRLARLFIEHGHQCDGKAALRFFRDEFLKWDGGSYRGVPDREIRARLTALVKAEFDRMASEQAQGD